MSMLPDNHVQNLLQEFATAYEDGLREQLNIPADWKFHDSRYMTKEVYDHFNVGIGEAPVRFVVGSTLPINGEVMHRFTAFFSPEAVENLRTYARSLDIDV